MATERVTPSLLITCPGSSTTHVLLELQELLLYLPFKCILLTLFCNVDIIISRYLPEDNFHVISTSQSEQNTVIKSVFKKHVTTLRKCYSYYSKCLSVPNSQPSLTLRCHWWSRGGCVWSGCTSEIPDEWCSWFHHLLFLDQVTTSELIFIYLLRRIWRFVTSLWSLCAWDPLSDWKCLLTYHDAASQHTGRYAAEKASGN